MCANSGNSSNSDDDDIGEHVVCPICQHTNTSDTDSHCEHVVFVVVEDMVNRFNTTEEMDNWLDKKIGCDMCDTITQRQLKSFAKKFGISLDSITEYGMCCGPVCNEFTFGFKENVK